MTSLDQVDGNCSTLGVNPSGGEEPFFPFFIGLTGPAGCGKDTAANAIDAALQHANINSMNRGNGTKRVRVMSLADPLKAVCAIVLGLTEEDMYTQEGKKRLATLYPHMTNREILQKVGTECFRGVFGGDVWVTALLHHAVKDRADIVIVPDVRFDNEAAMVKEHGVLIEVIPSYPGFARIEQSSHASEKGVTLPPDVIIMNDGTPEEFKGRVLDYVRTLNLV